MRIYSQCGKFRIVSGFIKRVGGEIEPTHTVQEKLYPHGWVTLWVSASLDAAVSSLKGELGIEIAR